MSKNKSNVGVNFYAPAKLREPVTLKNTGKEVQYDTIR